MAQAQPKDWREKYFDLVETQDSLQQQFDDQLEQMRRALVRVSLAADGADPELDSVLAALREHLKSPEKQNQLHKRLAVVEEAIIAFDERKIMRLSCLQQAIEQLLEPIQTLNISRAVNKACRSLSKGLKQRLEQQQELPAVLQELSALQQIALQQEIVEKPGFMQKLLAGKGAGSEGASELTAAQTEPFDLVDEEGIKQTFVGELSVVIREIVELIDTGTKENKNLESLREQLNREIDSSALKQVLEQVRELIRQTVAKTTSDFSEFLLKTNDELNSITAILNNVAQAAGEQTTERQQLRVDMDQHLQSLQNSVKDAADLEQLKQQVNCQLETIREKIAQYDNKPNTLSDQLKKLLGQVERFESEAKVTAEFLSQQQQKAQHDSLTGLFNREAYNERCKTETARWQRYDNPLTIAVLDIDHFKNINDSYGHQAGDKVLRLIAQALQKRLRDVDFIARYGGEEFVVLLPETNSKNAKIVLDKLRQAIAETPFHFRKQPVQITLSVGLSEFVEGDTEVSAFARADKALYQSKNNGRNCITIL